VVFARLIYIPSMATDAEESENARAGYQSAVELMVFEGNLVWARYGLMLLAHTIILTAIGLTADTPRPIRMIILVGLSLVGLTLCVLWWLVNDIGFRYFFYWLFAARELEEKFLAPVRTLSRGTPLTGEGTVTLQLDGESRKLKIKAADRRHMVVSSRLIIIIFSVLYIGLLAVFTANLTGGH
jgi:hypothetical protein